MMETNNTQFPPPSYQQGHQKVPPAGQNYYQPPATVPEGGYAPPPPVGSNGVQQRFTQFYTPPQNRSLGLKRRFCSIVCCCILIGLIVGLSAGLTTKSRNRYSSNRSCNCRYNSDCTRTYGSGTYCYASCQCARR